MSTAPRNVNSTTRQRVRHVLVVGLTLGILSGAAMPLAESAAADTAPPGPEPTTTAPIDTVTVDATDTTTLPSTTLPPATTVPATTVPPATTVAATTVPATTVPPATTLPTTTTMPATTMPATTAPPITPTAVPSAPTWLSPIVGGADVTLQWTVPADGGSPILDYVVEQRAGDSTEWTIVPDAVDPINIASANGLVPGTPYHFRVHAVNQDGPGPTSDELTVTPRTTPGPVQTLTAAPTSVAGRVRVQWTAPAFDGGAPITDYVVQRSDDPEHSWIIVDEGIGTATSAVIDGLVGCTRHYFRVFAVNEAGAAMESSVVDTVPDSVPAAPGSLTATPTNLSGQVRLTWTAPPACMGASPITDYVIQRALFGSGGWTTVGDGVSTATSYTLTGLVNGTTYIFRVSARNAAGQSPPSGNMTATPRTVPSAPRTLTATATGVSGQVGLAWLAPQSDGGAAITDYLLQRSTNATTGWVTISDGVNVNTAYTVTGLANGTRYYFRVSARNAAGVGAPSTVVSAIPRNVLTAPRSLTATPTNLISPQVRLSWTVPLSTGGRAITDYVIQRSPDGSTGWLTITDGVNTATTYNVSGLTNGVRYYFRVFARTGTITGPASNVANAIPRTVPTAPRSLAAAPTNRSGQIRLTWLAPASNGGSVVTDYLVQRSTNGTTWTVVADGVNTATAYTVTGLTNGARYYFRVFAKNAFGFSPASAAVSAIPRTVPSQPAFVQVVASFEGFLLSWGAPLSTGGSPITGYVVQAWNGATWVTLGVAPATWRSVFIDAPGEGCGSFRVAAMNAAGTGPFLGPVTDCWP